MEPDAHKHRRLGYTIQRPTGDRFLLGRSDLEKRIPVLMGGRAAEQLIFDGDVSTGAADDLQRATEITLEMVTGHGMDEKVGQCTHGPEPKPLMPAPTANHVEAPEITTRKIDVAVRDLRATFCKLGAALSMPARNCCSSAKRSPPMNSAHSRRQICSAAAIDSRAGGSGPLVVVERAQRVSGHV